MSKILKQKYNRTLIILLATIIMILLAIYIPYIVSAVEFSGFSNKTSPSASPGTINFSDINVNDTITIGSAQHIFTNENIYCIEKGQSLKGEQEHTYRYILKVTYDSEGITWVGSVNNKGIDFDIDNNPNDAAEFWKFVNALGYILSFTGEFERPGGTSFSNTDPYQQALWELVYRYPRVADWMFYTELSNKEIELDDNPKAKEIYDNAINYTGAQGEFTIYVLRDETSVDGDNEYEYDYQTLILVEKADIPETPEVELEFKKTYMSNKGLGNAGIKIESHNNCTVSTTDELKSASDGYFGKITVNPTNNNGTFQIKVKETTVPGGYIGISDTILTVTYDTTSGNVTGITSNNSTYVTSSGSTVTIKNRPAVKLTFEKQNFGGTKLSGAEIKVTAKEKVSKITGIDTTNNYLKDANNDGTFDEIMVYPSDDTGTFKLQIEETTAPTGYKGFSGTIELEVDYDVNNGTVNSVTSNNTTYIPDVDNKTIVIKNKPATVNLSLKKEDFSGKGLSGAVIELSANYNVTSISSTSLTSNANGSFGTITIEPTNNDINYFILNLKETTAPTGYKSLSSSSLVTLTVYYDTTTGVMTEIKNEDTTTSLYVPSVTGSTVTIKNKPKLDLIINKTDSLTGVNLADARFKIELTNVESMENYQIAATKGQETQNSPTMVYVKTDENGQIKLTGIVPTNGKDTITATITEVEVPTATGYYYKPIEPITITMTYANGAWSVSGGGATCSENVVTLGITNTPYIELSGMVWEDKQKYEKQQPEPPNGEKDDGELGLQGVLVRLYDVATEEREVASTYTDANGQYTFTDIPKTINGYRVVFNYDGINYQETSSLGNYGKHSKIEKIEETGEYEYYRDAETTTRDDFSNIFKTISSGKATSNDGGTTTPLGYNYSNGTSTLKVNMDGANPANTQIDQNGLDSKDFQMRARTAVYNVTTLNLDCGLVKKELDLALGTYIDKTILTINGATNEYTDFAEIIIDESSNQPKVEFSCDNFYLYRSDYNYRKSDYVTDKNDENHIENNVNPNNVERNQIAGEELKAYVTYKIELMNQTPSKEACVDKFVYYYDSRYTLLLNESDLNGYKINSNTNNVIEFEKINKNEYFTDKIELTLKFEIDIEGLGENPTYYGNAGEIIEYSTKDGGLIDKDSAPGNANITRDAAGKAIVNIDEDDSVQAEEGLNIQIKESKTRKISGTVFEDTDNDGKNNENSSVKDVVVQLIEIKYISGEFYEYIWQETTTNDSGYYEFTNFIPVGENTNANGAKGYNYIVRFIYGDGAAYDLTVNTAEYNGQDYKSTKDINYTRPFYKEENYETGASVARDNEARRLEVMAHSSTVDGNVGTALEIFAENIQFNGLTVQQKQYIVEYYNSVVKSQYESVKNANEDAIEEANDYLIAKRIRNIFGDTLPDITTENIDEDLYNKIKRYVSFRTWMCAETSMINIPLDVTYNPSSEQSVNYENMNFGLALRPNTNIVLEKHITALKITPSGTGVQSIVDASKSIAAYYDENSQNDSPTGMTQGLTTIMSERNNRGFWKVETDVEELMQGAELEVEYTYVIKNDSEKDYLSNTLVEAYENQDTYNATLGEIKNAVRTTMRNGSYSYSNSNNNTIGTYLGDFYYTGNKGDNDELVSSKVNTFEEALNNDLVFNSSDATSFEIKEQGVDKKIYGVNSSEGVKDITINTVVQNELKSAFLSPGEKDDSKIIKLKATLATVSGGELGANLPSYIAEIVEYTNAAGRRNMNATPANLSYVHSNDNDMTMKNSNEVDEFWGESIIITKPTGEDKSLPLQIAIITISALATLGVGIVLIKKVVLKK